MTSIGRPDDPRFVTLDPSLIESPMVAEMHQRWLSARKDNQTPGFWDLQMWERPELLPFVSVVTIQPKGSRVRYRYVGEAVKQFCHMDLAGVYLDECNFSSAAWTENVFRRVSETGQPLFGYDSWTLPDGAPLDSFFGVFPLTDRGGEATSCVAIDDYLRDPVETARDFLGLGEAVPDPDAYPRTTSLDFLGYCRESTAAVYAYWNDKRGERFAPRPDEIDLAELARWQHGLLFVDVARGTGRLTYRWVGERSRAARGYDPTGMTVEDAYFGRSAAAALENYRLIVEEHAVVYDWDHIQTSDGLRREEEGLGLPLSSDGKSVDMVMAYLEFDDGN